MGLGSEEKRGRKGDQEVLDAFAHEDCFVLLNRGRWHNLRFAESRVFKTW